ncbi:aldose epimerase family protein [Cellulophaga sp. Hel_I_12]|uniref:aldose epimerase family protein n=1 Tax=Cellulophaga sp. Hel_I_12 TaxID=1249972 RepID=UPI000648988B|nr:aldose epimerase family protein [Cellulophaga sp. Hel_I_12]
MKQITLKNKHTELTVLDYGAIIQKLVVHDKNGHPTNVVLGYENPEQYLQNPNYLGACIGRYAGRISKGEFSLEGKNYKLFSKNGIHLHGGKTGFDQKQFTIEEVHQEEEPFVKLSYLSTDMEEGYPGNLKLYVTYKLIANEVHMIHEAYTDKTTVVNVTNHSYFKLDAVDNVNHYELYINSIGFIDMDAKLLPTGNLLAVQNTKFDFLKAKKINGVALDSPFAINPIKPVIASAFSEISGIFMEVETNQKCVVVYTPSSTAAICFETQNYPDAPNHSNFPSSVLKPNETYKNESIFRFSVRAS